MNLKTTIINGKIAQIIEVLAVSHKVDKKFFTLLFKYIDFTTKIDPKKLSTLLSNPPQIATISSPSAPKVLRVQILATDIFQDCSEGW